MFVSPTLAPTLARTHAETNAPAETRTPAANLKARERSALARQRAGPVVMTRAAAPVRKGPEGGGRWTEVCSAGGRYMPPPPDPPCQP